MLDQKTVDIGGTTYIVKELTIGQALPIMERMGGEDSASAQNELLKLALHDSNGIPLGESALELGISHYMKLVQHVLEVNGMGEASGND